MKLFYDIISLFIVAVISTFSYATAQELRSINHEGIERTFIHYTPSNYHPDSSYSLLFALHGFTQNADAIMDYSKFNLLAEENNFIAVYPNGVNNSWNTQSGFPGGSTANDVGFIETLIDLISNEQNINPNRIYSCGLSAGGFMSYILACELQDRLAAIASVAGTYSPSALNNCQPDRPFPILHIHGSDDLIVPPGGNFAALSVEETLQFWRNQNGCLAIPEITQWPDEAGDGTTIEQIDYLNCQGSAALQYLRVINGGHTWPGAPVGSGLGTTTQNLDATVAIWDFFSQFESPEVTQQEVANGTAVRVFPNPARDQIQFELHHQNRISSLKIFQFDGQIVFDKENLPGNTKINISTWKSGNYYIKIDGQALIPLIKI